MRTWTISAGVVLAFLIMVGGLWADTVTLQDGSVVQGTIVDQDGDRVKVEVGGALRVYPMEDVERIDRQGSASSQGLPPIPATSAPAITVEHPVTPARRAGPYKSPHQAFRMSCFLPGAGQFYTEEYGKGMLQLGLVIGGVALAIAEAPRYQWVEYYDLDGYYLYTAQEQTGGNDTACGVGIVVAAASWIWSALDAPGCAEGYNRRNRMTLWEDPLKNRTLAVEPVLFEKKASSGLQVAYRF